MIPRKLHACGLQGDITCLPDHSLYDLGVLVETPLAPDLFQLDEILHYFVTSVKVYRHGAQAGTWLPLSNGGLIGAMVMSAILGLPYMGLGQLMMSYE